MDVADIVKRFLEENGYDGLYTEECGCLKDYLFPCRSAGIFACVPGHLVPLESEEGVKCLGIGPKK